jgi:hypothetical protein
MGKSKFRVRGEKRGLGAPQKGNTVTVGLFKRITVKGRRPSWLIDPDQEAIHFSFSQGAVYRTFLCRGFSLRIAPFFLGISTHPKKSNKST